MSVESASQIEQPESEVILWIVERIGDAVKYISDKIKALTHVPIPFMLRGWLTDEDVEFIEREFNADLNREYKIACLFEIFPSIYDSHSAAKALYGIIQMHNIVPLHNLSEEQKSLLEQFLKQKFGL